MSTMTKSSRFSKHINGRMTEAQIENESSAYLRTGQTKKRADRPERGAHSAEIKEERKNHTRRIPM